MTDELKPCPFCGGEAEITKNEMRVWVHCTKCYSDTNLYQTQKEAVDAWNLRPIDDYSVKYEPNSYSCRSCKNGTDEEIKRLEAENKRLREALELIAKAKFYFARGEEEKQIRRVCEIAEDALKGCSE